MKEKLKRMTATVFAICIMLGIPVNVRAADRCGILPMPEKRHFEEYSMEISLGGDDDSEMIIWEYPTQGEESESEIPESEISESETEIPFSTWTLPEVELVEDESEEILLNQKLPEEESEKASLLQMEMSSENSLEYDAKDCMNVRIVSKIMQNQELDYRESVDNDMKTTLEIRLERSTNGEVSFNVPGVPEDESIWITQEELEGIEYKVKIENTDVLRINDGKEHNYKSGKPCTYILSQNTAEIIIAGVGETDYEISLRPNKKFTASKISGHTKVTDSELKDSDFYFEIPGSDRRFTLDEWKKYLAEHDNWLNSRFEISLSDTGKKYFDSVEIKKKETNNKTEKKEEYLFWAENKKRNASTKKASNGMRSFCAGIDKTAPLLNEMSTDSVCYEPTRTDTRQYFSEDFVLEGKFRDRDSGISKIEYTTDITAGEKTVWKPVGGEKQAEDKETEDKETEDKKFRIILSDGVYNAIAVRACDYAGNVSEVTGFVNNDGEYISVIVDKSEPVIDVKGMADGIAYSGENEKWTNKDVTFDIALGKNSCPYAGIYKCEYSYETIGDAVNRQNMTGASENWTQMLAGDTGNNSVKNDSVKIKEDRNGYYYFRVVSKSGVVSRTTPRERILLQHSAPGIKPVIVNEADASKQKNGWYNKASGVPVIRFEYPDYDTGDTSGEYDAPVIIHYKLTAETEETDSSGNAGIEKNNGIEKNAAIGVMSCGDVSVDKNGVTKFLLTKENLDTHTITFGYDSNTNEASDGIYTLEYWISDKAGNVSEKQVQVYKIDCHEPADLTVELGGSTYEAGKEPEIVYEKFYQDSVSGNVSAKYGISGKGVLTVLKAKKIGEWKDAGEQKAESGHDAGDINIAPNTRCFLYIRAEDGAGNISEGWTKGFVVDNMAPNQQSKKSLIIEPAGANQHGFFNNDVKVDISVKDSPEDDNCAALSLVTGTVGKDGRDTVSEKELFSFTKQSPTDAELTGAAVFEGTQTVSAKDNESNEAYIEVTAVDRAGNHVTSKQQLKIDVTKPRIDISFNDNNPVNEKFYHTHRTVVIHVQELNFDAAAVDISVTKDGHAYDYQLSDWTSDGINHYASITLAEDGEYVIGARCTDLADNESETVKSDAFIIDCTAPVLTIDIKSNQENTSKEGYFNNVVSVAITVQEHNFDPDGLVFEDAVFPKGGTWSHDGDLHTLHFSLDSDSAYRISCVCTDKAGNVSGRAGEQFVIDTASPLIAIHGVEDGSAVSGEILPVITVLDLNMDAQDTSITVTTGTGEAVDIAVEVSAVDDVSGTGYRFTLPDLNDKPDNIYYLAVTAGDRAGNESSLMYRFSLNRNGSAYDLTHLVNLMARQYVTYAGLEDIRIVEMNIDTVEDFGIYISRNGELGYKAVYQKEVQGTADTGYTYMYSVARDNFAEEGTYKLTLYSRDRAGNEVNNKKVINGSEIVFIIDNTAPKVVMDGVEAGMLYNAESKQVHVSVADNFKLSEAEFTLVNKANEVIGSWDYMESCKDGGQLDITLPQYNGEVSLLYRVKDAAGNEVQTFQGEQTALSGILVTTDKVVQFMNKPSKTPAGRALWGIMGIAAAVAAMAGMGLLERVSSNTRDKTEAKSAKQNGLK